MKKVVIIISIALLVRLVFCWVWLADGRAEHISSDSRDYYALAQSLNHGDGFQIDGEWVSRRPPLYAVFLAAVIRILPFPLGVQAFQIIFSVMSCLLAYGLGRRLFGEIPGFFAGVLLAINYEFVRQSMTVMPEVLYVLFILTSLWFTFRAAEKLSWHAAGAAGAFAGFSLLTKDSLILFYPLVALWLLQAKGRLLLRVLLMLCYCLGLMVILLPWKMVNASHKSTHKVVLSDRLGMTFYIANNPKATGGTGGQEWALGRDSFLPSDDELAGVSDTEVDHYCFRQGLTFIYRQPKQFCNLMVKKIVNMWRPSISNAPKNAQVAMAATYTPLLILGLGGMILSLKRWKSLLPLYILPGYIFLLHAVLIAHIRYRFPVIPVLAIFAGSALFYAVEKVRGRFLGQSPNPIKVV